MRVKELTAQEILSIPVDRFDRLFSHSDHEKEFKVLRKLWHPDMNDDPKAGDVFTHIYELNIRAVAAVADCAWPGSASVRWRGRDSSFELKYRRAIETEIGMQYVADSAVLFMVKPEFEHLFLNAARMIENLKYAGDEMRTQFAPLLPDVMHVTKTGNCLALLLRKTPEVYSLRDLLTQQGGALDPKHVAWVLSRLHNLTAYFEFAGLSHQALDLDSLFVSPEYHSIMVYGGWWYAAALGSKVKHVPGKLLSYYPKRLLEDKEAILRTDQALIKHIGLQLLGDDTNTGVPLLGRPDIPTPLLQYLQSPPNDSAIRAYAQWSSVLEKSFGVRKFVKLEVSASDIYA